MKHYIIIFIFLSLSAIIYLSYPFPSFWWMRAPARDFVSISNNKFFINGEIFYPIVLNCKISMQTDGNEVWPCIYPDYNPNGRHTYTSKDSSLFQLLSEMELIKDLGFNTVRIVGIGEVSVNKNTKNLFIGASNENNGYVEINFPDEDNYKKYFKAVGDLLEIANKVGLKTIILVHTLPEISASEKHLIKFISHFNHNNTIMAYDLFNEPLYFDSLERKKDGPAGITNRWNKLMKKYAPRQLYTIGLANVREVFEWDPNLLEVDFISFHPYEYEPEMVRNETYWYNNYVKKPWIIGETGYPADNDSIGYDVQLEFAWKTLKQVNNCTGAGYSWWQYKDVDWHVFYPNYLGVVSRIGETMTSKGNLVTGTPKPVTEAFKKFSAAMAKDSCQCLPNYYNYSALNKFKITGFLTDESGIPIQGGVVLGWDEFWAKSFYTFTKPDGSFELFGNFPYFHWMASATEYSMVRGNISPDTAKIASDNVPEVNLGKLRLRELQ